MVALGRQVGPGTAVLGTLGRQVGPGTVVWEALGSQVGPETVVWEPGNVILEALKRCFGTLWTVQDTLKRCFGSFVAVIFGKCAFCENRRFI